MHNTIEQWLTELTGDVDDAKASCEQEGWLTQAEVAEAADTTPTTVWSHRDTLEELTR